MPGSPPSWVPNNEWVSATKSVDFQDGILEIKMDAAGPQGRVGGRGLRARRLQDAGFGVVQPRWRAVDADARPVRDGTVTVASGFSPASATSWACRTASSRAGRPRGIMPLAGRLWRDVALIGRPDLAQHRPTSADRLVVGCCRGWAARSSPTGSGASTSGPRRATPSCRWPRRSGRHRSNRTSRSTTRPARDRSARSWSRTDNQEILVTRDGIDWDIQSMPAEMAADWRRQAGDDGRRGRAFRAGPGVGAEYPRATPSLWLGTPEP